MKKNYLLILLSFFGLTVFAQQSERAKQILDEVSKKTQECTSISAEFEYNVINEEEGVDEGYSGSIILKGNNYKVDISELGIIMVSDGETIWSYMEDANEVRISTFDEETSELMDPVKIFTIYEEGFNYNYTGEKNENGKSVYIIDLIPETEEFEFSKVTIAIDKQNMMIYSATMTDEMGTNYRIVAKKLELNNPVDDSVFTFNPAEYDDIEIIDLR